MSIYNSICANKRYTNIFDYISQQQRTPEDFERNCYFIAAKKVEMIFSFIRIIKTYGNLLKFFCRKMMLALRLNVLSERRMQRTISVVNVGFFSLNFFLSLLSLVGNPQKRYEFDCA